MKTKKSNNSLVLYILISILFAIFSYFYIDIQLNTIIEKNRTDNIKYIAEIVTNIGNGKYYYITLIMLIIYFYFINKNKILLKKINFSLLLMLSTAIITYISKFIIGRGRPNMYLNEGKYEFHPFNFNNSYDYTSMPSGHTQTSFTVAIILSMFFPKYRNIFIIIAITSSLSRVVLSSHWLSDVVMGAVFGITIPVLLINKYKNKF